MSKKVIIQPNGSYDVNGGTITISGTASLIDVYGSIKNTNSDSGATINITGTAVAPSDESSDSIGAGIVFKTDGYVSSDTETLSIAISGTNSGVSFVPAEAKTYDLSKLNISTTGATGVVMTVFHLLTNVNKWKSIQFL
jgi:hypothetical protein